MDEKSLREQFERAVDARPATPHLVAGALRAGTRLRRRRRIEAATAAAVAAALISVGVSATAGALGTSGRHPAAGGGTVQPTAYVAMDTATDPATVVPIRISTGTALAPMRFPGWFAGIQAAPGGKAVFVFSRNIHVSYATRINTVTGKAGSPVVLRGGSPHPSFPLQQIQVEPGGRTAIAVEFGIWPSSPFDYGLVAINLVTGAVRKLLVGNDSSFALTPDGKTAYFPGVSRAVERVDTATGTVLPPVRLSAPGDTREIALSPGGHTAYVTSTGSVDPASKAVTWVTPIDLATGAAGKPVRVQADGGYNIAIAPDGTGYVSGYREVTPVNLSAGKAFRPIRLPRSIGSMTEFVVSPDGRIGYITTPDLLPIDLVSDTVLRPVSRPGGFSPDGLAAFAPGGKVLYAALSGPEHRQTSGIVIPIQTATQRVGKPVNLNGTPRDIVIVG
jgi:DNA-binding beta-propeller fold protein YncE